jgi:two-component system, cell cycle sensor histidine kinase and response regulator CckA
MKKKSLRVLMVEASEDDVLLIRRELEKGGYHPEYKRVETAASMKKAIKEKQWDIILCDASLPGFKAPSAIAFLKKTKTGIPLIVISGPIGEETATEFMRSGAHDYFLKGKLSRLCSAINRELKAAKASNRQKQLAEKLRISEAQFNSIIATSQEWIWATDNAGNHTFSNPAIENILGYTPDEIIRHGAAHHLVHEEDIPKMRETMSRSIEQKKGWSNIVVRWKHKDGTIRYLESNAVPIFDSAGFLKGFHGSDRDITDRKNMEEMLRESEINYRQLFDNSPAGIYRLDFQSGRFIKANDVFCEYAGCSREEINSLSPYDILTEESRKLFLDRVEKISQGIKVPEIVEFEILNKKGKRFHVQLHIKNIYDAEGRVIAADVVAHDITERKKVEDALRESEELYIRLVDTLPDLVIRTDFEGKILFANDNTFKMGQYRPEEVEGRNILEFLPIEEHLKAIEKITLILMEGKKQGPNEYSLFAKDGQKIPYEIISDVFLNKDGTPSGYVHVCRDISQRKQAELEKEHLQERLNQSQKMESVGRLAGGVAHDFNNMLGVILGHTELAMARVESGHPIHAHLREIGKAAERSADLTRQLLAFARKQTFFPRVIDLNETVEGMLEMLQRLIGEDIHLSWLPEGGPLQVKMDPSQLDQILANLCVNARDAISGVGKITIESGNIIFDKTFCADHPDFNHGAYVLLAVSDNGCGMDQETRNKLFEPFFTTKDIGKGTGLGLCTVYGIVRQNSGFVNVYSEPDQGTTFKIYLPRHTGKTEKTKIEEPPEPVARGRETVLVVEDELAILDLSKIILEKQGYQVLSAATPGEAIKLAVEHNGEIHLLITDVVMPEMNGRDLANRILSLYPNMKRLFMSGYTADIIAHQGILDKEMFFIQKPFSRNDLLVKAREALDQK